MAEKEINKIEGADGNRLSTLRYSDEELDRALLAPISTMDSRNRERNQRIVERLLSHGWNKMDIRKVLKKKNSGSTFSFKTNDSHFNSILTDAGYRQSHSPDTDDDPSFTTDDSDDDFADPEDFSNITDF